MLTFYAHFIVQLSDFSFIRAITGSERDKSVKEKQQNYHRNRRQGLGLTEDAVLMFLTYIISLPILPFLPPNT